VAYGLLFVVPLGEGNGLLKRIHRLSRVTAFLVCLGQFRVTPPILAAAEFN
jgi:hypothetical protein